MESTEHYERASRNTKRTEDVFRLSSDENEDVHFADELTVVEVREHLAEFRPVEGRTLSKINFAHV